MNINIKRIKIVVTTPKENAEEIRKILGAAGAGVIGNYSYCSMATDCVGTFMPQDDANPYIGEKNRLETVAEIKIEVVCDIGIVKEVLRKLRGVHPYEEPAIDIIPLLDEIDL